MVYHCHISSSNLFNDLYFISICSLYFTLNTEIFAWIFQLTMFIPKYISIYTQEKISRCSAGYTLIFM